MEAGRSCRLSMTRIYSLLLLHFFICIVLFTIHPLIAPRVIPYGLIGVTLIITFGLAAHLLLAYPSERMNPFALLSFVYSLQFAVAIYLVKWHKVVSRNELMQYYNNIEENNLVEALRLSYIFSFFTIGMAFLFSRSAFWPRILQTMNKALDHDRKLLLLVSYGITLIEFMLIASGKVTLQGESLIGRDKSNIEVNPFVSIINPIACLAVFLSAYLFTKTKDKKLLLLLLIQFVWFFLWGRRQIVFFTFLTFIGFFYERKIILSKLTVRNLRMMVVSAALFFMVINAAKFYQQLRTVGGVAVLQNVTITSLRKVINLYQSSDNIELKKASEYNVEIRALSTVAAVAHYEKLLASGGVQLANGQELYNNFLKATPSNFFVDKSSVLIMEGLASKLSSGKIRANRDLGGTLILESMIDFGRLGVYIYPLVLTIIILAFFWMLVHVNNPFVMLWFVIALDYSMLAMVESSIGDLFLAMRVTLFVMLIMGMFWVTKRTLLTKPVKGHHYQT